MKRHVLPFVLFTAACILFVMAAWTVSDTLGYLTAGLACLAFERRVAAEGEDR